MWKFAAYLVAGVAGMVLFSAGAMAFVHVYMDHNACSDCQGDSLKAMPEAALLPDGAKLLNAYSVNSSDFSNLDPAYIREMDSGHTVAAITGYYDQQLLSRGWARQRSTAPTINAGIAGLTANHVVWAKGDLRLDVSFEIDASAFSAIGGAKPPSSSPQRFTATLARIQ